MSRRVFGIDFGTTNSLASLVVGDQTIPFVDQQTERPHPSVIWYRGESVVVGTEAKQNLDVTDGGAPPGFVRSPKMALRREGPLWVDGRQIQPAEAIAQVLMHLRSDAAKSRGAAPGEKLDRAVMTIPVNFAGPERRALRQAAGLAGISVTQFVHEPVAALYAHIRTQADFVTEMARLDNRSVLVFDWGGGTLDLTLCRIQGGRIVQIANIGDNDVGGDRFDEQVRSLIRSKHAKTHDLADVSALEFPGMGAKLLNECETVKILLSAPDAMSEGFILRNYLKAEGAARDLRGTLTKQELETATARIVNQGLTRIDEIVDRARLSPNDIAFCLATGGMVNMPAIRSGLNERFLGRVPKLKNGDRIISEGAAWIAHDELRLTLAKPIELLVADTSGKGTYHPIAPSGWRLPVENELQNVYRSELYCTDPREGAAIVEIATPLKVGAVAPSDPRRAICVARVQVDRDAPPLIEAIKCHVQIDHNYIGTVELLSTGLNHASKEEFHDLEFGLALPQPMGGNNGSDVPDESAPQSGPAGDAIGSDRSNVVRRSSVATITRALSTKDELWQTVPGHLLHRYRSSHFDTRSMRATPRQQQDKRFYDPCATCGRIETRIRIEGRGPSCRASCKT